VTGQSPWRRLAHGLPWGGGGGRAAAVRQWVRASKASPWAVAAGGRFSCKTSDRASLAWSCLAGDRMNCAAGGPRPHLALGMCRARSGLPFRQTER
jgi:hypothetical protein